MRWLGRLFAKPDPVRVWNVQFDRGGREYAYRMTAEQLRAEMAERYQLRGNLPHRVTTIQDGRVVEVNLDVRD